MDYSKATVILADGAFPESIHVQQILRQAARIIACDGAAKTVAQWGREPDWIAGDLDSLDKNLQELWSDRVLHISEQETNDLNKAFCCALKMTAPEDPLLILGATGKREDHTLGNISLLADFSCRHANIRLLTDTGIFRTVQSGQMISAVPGQAVSIFNPTGFPIRATSQGLKYPLNDLELNIWWRATLNTALQETFSLTFTPADTPLLVYLAYA
jgi:thiamine pyrophosphokinase